MKTWIPDMSWERDVEAIDREIAREAAVAALQSADAVAGQRRAFELELAAELDRVVAERGRGVATTHDAALALANVATRFGHEYDRDEVAQILSRDPEPLEAAPVAGIRPTGKRAAAAADDQAFGDRLAALAAEARALARLRRRANARQLGNAERSLRSIRGAIDELLPPSSWA